MRRSGMPPRTTRIARGTKPLPKVNPARKAKRKKYYAAFLGSPAWKVLRAAALDLAGHRCQGEREYMMTNYHGVGIGMSTTRCWETEKLTVHHQTYARFGGRERPEDLLVLCRSCHNRVHAMEGKHVG